MTSPTSHKKFIAEFISLESLYPKEILIVTTKHRSIFGGEPVKSDLSLALKLIFNRIVSLRPYIEL